MRLSYGFIFCRDSLGLNFLHMHTSDVIFFFGRKMQNMNANYFIFLFITMKLGGWNWVRPPGFEK